MLYNILVYIVRLVVGRKLSITLIGLENIPIRGPALFVFNHSDFLDSVVLPLALSRRMTALVAYEYRFNPVVFLFYIARNVIFVKRGQGDTAALTKAIKTILTGGIVTMSPEGTRGNSPSMGQGKYGAAYIAASAKCKVLPIGIHGTYGGFKQLVMGFCKRSKIYVTVNIGTPFYVQAYSACTNGGITQNDVKSYYAGVTNTQIMSRIRLLLPVSMRRR